MLLYASIIFCQLIFHCFEEMFRTIIWIIRNEQLALRLFLLSSKSESMFLEVSLFGIYTIDWSIPEIEGSFQVVSS